MDSVALEGVGGGSRAAAGPGVRIGSVYSTDSVAGTLDAHLKQYLARATAGWVAVVLERAGVVEMDRTAPAKVKLAPNW
jgi:hypothetical protein